MRVPVSWLRDFLPDAPPVDELVRVLPTLGLAVEEVVQVGDPLDGVVVARVLDIAAIDGADKIRLVQVDAGGGAEDPVSVVCGAWNFEVGDLVPLATVGTVLPGDFEISQRKLRGVVSNGMLCAADELGLGADHAGIMVLGQGEVDGLEPGRSFVEATGLGAEVVLDLEVNGNRPDCQSILGVARDLGAKLGLDLVRPEVRYPTSPAGSAGGATTVEVEAPEGCGRFLTRVLTGVSVGPSPLWLARRVELAGMRSISNVVDVSNYVMLELGQPNHAYDLATLPGRGLRVRWAHPGERLVTLDDVERTLSGADLLICDAEDTPVGLAGIMGGASSEISDATTEVVVELAWFDAMTIARTSKRLNLRSEASARFERGTDPEVLEAAAERVSTLLGAVGATTVADADVVVGAPPARTRVRLRTARVNALLGTDLGDDVVVGHLESIGFTATPADAPGAFDVDVPSWRPDAALEIDMVEEVARLHGYDRIPKTVPVSGHTGHLTAYQRARRRLRHVVAGTGVSEAWTTTFVSPADLDRVGLDRAMSLSVTNPLVADESQLRPSLLPGLLTAAAYNTSHRQSDVCLFEIGRTFRRPADSGARLPDEREELGVLLAGHDAVAATEVWQAIAEGLSLDPASIELVAGTVPGLHPTRSAQILLGGQPVGWVGEVDPAVVGAYALPGRVGWVTARLDLLLAERPAAQLRPISRFPSSDVDLAFEVADSVPAAAVERTLREGAALVVDVWLFDVYRGAPVAEGHRSLAFTVRFQAPDRTLTDDEVAEARSALVAAVSSTHGATLRS